MFKTIRLLLGDQLNYNHSWFNRKADDCLYVMMEIKPEQEYVTHHIQKIIAFFLSMRTFCDAKIVENFEFKYFRLDDADNRQSFEENILALIEAHKITNFEYQLPDEFRLDGLLKNFSKNLEERGVSVAVCDTEHFLSRRSELTEIFQGKKTFLMETFYRKMRTRFNILMEADGKTPLQGQFNFDADNRKSLSKNVVLPKPYAIKKNVSDIISLLEKMEIKTIGRLDAENFNHPTSREEALQCLHQFAEQRLINFGTYEDAMTVRDPFLFHSQLSFAMNVKILSPLEVVKYCVSFWEKNQDDITIAQIEGFVRQIIGWREYMRGIYWAKMPDFAMLNFFEHKAKLPQWFWSGETKMNCLKHAINQSLDYAYAHHIQRLMITGAFALLLGVDPDELDAWYLGIYIDAIEWVEITNTRGMSQYADGGIVGTKPYVGSANYIDKMSDYCSGCYYNKKEKLGERGCPFNSLYWDFYHRHTHKLERNPRIGMMYPTLRKMNPEDLGKILERAAFIKVNVDSL